MPRPVPDRAMAAAGLVGLGVDALLGGIRGAQRLVEIAAWGRPGSAEHRRGIDHAGSVVVHRYRVSCVPPCFDCRCTERL